MLWDNLRGSSYTMAKRAVITGASRGIGAAISRRFLQGGYQVIGSQTSTKEGGPFFDEKMQWLELDLTDAESVDSFCEFALELSSIDVLVLNAGTNVLGLASEFEPHVFDRLMSLNVRGHLEILSRLTPLLLTSESPRVVGLSSIWSTVGKAQRGNYSASKAALVAALRVAAIELGESGVLVNTVSPGFTRTELTEKTMTEKDLLDAQAKIPLGRIAETREIAEVVHFLGSESNTYLTGQNIVVDGGYTSA